MKRFPRGSEWRKWDLHVHPPGTKLSDGYRSGDGKAVVDQFCKALHESDVQVFGITDYFSLDGFFAVKKRYTELYPESDKAFFPNLELRLNEAVNRATEPVDFHIIFPPDLSQEKAAEFLTHLKTQNTSKTGRQESCLDLKACADYEKATVSRDGVQEAMNATFGGKGDHTDFCMLLSAVNNSGIRADKGSTRKRYLADEIDKLCDGFFGNPANTEYFLDPNRLEAEDQTVAPKPVFAGCDAHSFDDLSSWLGCEDRGTNAKHVTWVKADPTFEGLQQTLIEPSERVRIQAAVPDKKEPYKVISRITFAGSDDFPDEVVFNPGLNAIIGSRSSGKSALLAYVAHAVDPVYAVAQQVACGTEEAETGPGASVTWASVGYLNYSVEWAAGEATTGRVIYIPQNSLYKISERPDEITAKIQPVVFRNDPEFEALFQQTIEEVDGHNQSIGEAVKQWFSLSDELASLAEEIRDLGDRKAVVEQQKTLKKSIEDMQKSSSLSDEEMNKYQEVIRTIGAAETRLKEIEKEKRDLKPYVVQSPDGKKYDTTTKVLVRLSVEPDSQSMPAVLASIVASLVTGARESIAADLKSALIKYRSDLDQEELDLSVSITAARDENSALIEKSLANVQIAELATDLKQQEDTLAEIDKRVALSKTKLEEQRRLRDMISTEVSDRDDLLKRVAEGFNASGPVLEDMTFSIEIDFDPQDIARISEDFNKHEKSPYIAADKTRIDLLKVLSAPGEFVEHMGSGKQKLNRGVTAAAQTRAVLTTTKDLRFVASLEGDRIGGFQKSSMTPGKQALFALTLILAETDEPWPLLIDQPEDDLDSRSVCDAIVKDLMSRKRERQILMVSHDANLVIGGDSEEIIVANRHGDDRPNEGGKMFRYLTGSLEHSKPKDAKAKLILESCGIREHACEILDGGEEAFQKRKNKYRI